MAEEKKDPVLSDAIKGKYTNKLIKPGPFTFKGERYDLTSMSESTAAKLVEAKCPYLEKVGESAKSADKTAAGGKA